jgi:AraC-like DNA-binding protein
MLLFTSERLEVFHDGEGLRALGVPRLAAICGVAALVTETRWVVRLAIRVAGATTRVRRDAALRELQAALAELEPTMAPDEVLRVLRGRDLLLSGRRQTDVAHELRYADETHFITAFRRVLGVTPGAYRRAETPVFRPAAAALVAVLLAVGCAGQVPTQRYAAITLNVGLPSHIVQELVAEHVKEAGWHVLSVDEKTGRVVAESNVDALGETVTRERWTFTTSGGHVSVERRFEARFERDGEWKSAEVVCDTYGYTRERQVAASLSVAISQKYLARVASDPSTLTARSN